MEESVFRQFPFWTLWNSYLHIGLNKKNCEYNQTKQNALQNHLALIYRNNLKIEFSDF